MATTPQCSWLCKLIPPPNWDQYISKVSSRVSSAVMPETPAYSPGPLKYCCGHAAMTVDCSSLINHPPVLVPVRHAPLALMSCGRQRSVKRSTLLPLLLYIVPTSCPVSNLPSMASTESIIIGCRDEWAERGWAGNYGGWCTAFGCVSAVLIFALRQSSRDSDNHQRPNPTEHSAIAVWTEMDGRPDCSCWEAAQHK